jgi:NAD(P)-dependent dehydrogenase (short-subunit alcohol dehydrogenase family)
MEFTGVVVAIPGGTGGLGQAVTLSFLRAGATVVTTCVAPSEEDRLTREAGALSARLSCLKVDVTDEGAVTWFAEEIVARHGRLDVLVNIVGGFAGGKPVWETDQATWDRMLNLNLKSAYLCSKAIVPQMIKQNRGWIVNVASRSSLKGDAGLSAYAASKAAELVLTQSLAEEVKPYHINVNAVLPSIIDTKANRQAMPTADHSLWPKPEAIAKVILFLCSTDAEVIHGATIPVYGRV